MTDEPTPRGGETPASDSPGGEERRGERNSRWRRRRPRGAESAEGTPQLPRAPQGNRENREPRPPRVEGGEPRGETREPRNESRGEPRESRGESREAREPRDARGGRDPRGGRDSRDSRGGRDSRDSRDSRGPRPEGGRGPRLPLNQRAPGSTAGGPAAGSGPRGPRPDASSRRPRLPEPIRADRSRPAPVQPPALRVLIAGGGTGGHIYPALAVADEIRRRNKDSQILFVGTKNGLEGRLVPEAGFAIEYLDLSGYVGRGLFARIRALFQFVSGVSKARKLIDSFQPELVLGTGGYVSGPAVVAGRMARRPTIIQEQNSVPGQMNRLLARWVDEVHVAFTETRAFFKDKSKVRLSGNPVLSRQPRGSLLALFQRYRLHSDRQTVLIFGGSRGAHSLNVAVAGMLPLFRGREDVQFVIQTGPEDHPMVLEQARTAGVTALVKPYLSPMEEFYTLATMVVCRAGAMTLAEVTQFALPAVLVPYPHAIYQHQLRNAEILCEKGAAELLLDKDMTPQSLAERIDALLKDESRRRELASNAWKLARPDAHERVVNAIEQLTHPVARRQPLDMDLEEAEAAEARPTA